MQNKKKEGSRANRPDMDWSQVHETVLMLELSAGQIDTALRDSRSSFDVLSSTFTEMAGFLFKQQEAILGLPTTPEGEEMKATMLETGSRVLEMMQQAIISFQFYDRLGQRLDHVCHSINALGVLVADRSKIYSPEEWVKLQSQIRSVYTTAEERAMFDAVMNGMSVHDALEHYVQELEVKSGGDIDLF
jgi:hypothetical protein